MDTVAYLHLPVGQSPPSLEGRRAFKALLVSEQPADDAWQALVSEWLVRSGCLFMSAWGHDCGGWHDSVDRANLAAFDFGEIPDDALVRTIWDDGPLTHALWFVANCAFHPTITTFDHTIIIHIAAEARRAELLSAFQKARDGER